MHHTRKATPLLGLAALAALCLTAPTARAQTLIDQSNEVADLSFGLGSNGDTAVGQTFTAPMDNVLTRFDLAEDNFPVNGSGAQVELQFHLAAWNGSAPGSDLATGTPFLTPTQFTTDQFYSFNLPGGGLSLTAGQQYVCYLTSLSDPRYTGTTASPLSYDGQNQSGHDYTGGQLIHERSGAWGGGPGADGDDGVFRAYFSAPTPPPSPFTIVLDHPSQSVRQGQTVVFSGTITNTSAQSQPADPNTFLSYGLGYPTGGFSGAFLAPTSAFTFGPGQSYTGPLFSITAPPTAAMRTYTYPDDYTSFSINEQGGGTIRYITTAPYSLTVTPEPSEFAGLTLGVLSLAGLALRARKRIAA